MSPGTARTRRRRRGGRPQDYSLPVETVVQILSDGERETGASSKLPASGPWAGRQFDPNGVRLLESHWRASRVAKGGMINSISRGTCENGLVVSLSDAEQKVLLEVQPSRVSFWIQDVSPPIFLETSVFARR